MKDLANPRVIWIKGAAFLLIAMAASGLLILEHPSVRVAVLLALAIWASCRAYYFAFYVIQHYVDPGYRFSGLWSFIVYVLRKRPGA
jgi:hypothetical protein